MISSIKQKQKQNKFWWSIVCVFTDEQWEKELDNELQEFELVDNGGTNNDDAAQNDDWEKDADNLLGDDDDNDEDLK